MSERLVKVEVADDPRFGIRIYRSVLPESICDVNLIEKAMSVGADPAIRWANSRVGDQSEVSWYRNSKECILRQSQIISAGGSYLDFLTLYDQLISTVRKCVNHYCSQYGLSMGFMEAVNFLKYEKGQYFSVHSDHSYSYTCTVSSVSYLNDDYSGGELYFPHIGYEYAPKRGDVVINPSNYICSHGSREITRGTKYSASIMFDHNSRFHKFPSGYNEDGTLATEI